MNHLIMIKHITFLVFCGIGFYLCERCLLVLYITSDEYDILSYKSGCFLRYIYLVNGRKEVVIIF